jgi:hypothetical protein
VLDASTQFTIDRVMQIYQEDKATLDNMAKRHAAELAPLQKRIEICRAWLLDYLNREGLENARTEHGLVYRSVVMSATVDPEGGWDQLLGFIFQGAMERVLDAIERGEPDGEAMQKFFAAPELALLNHAVNKTAVREKMEQGITVPGVKIAHVTNIGVRKA